MAIKSSSETLKNVCPMTLSRADGPFECCEKQCMWYVDKTLGGHCAVRNLAFLENIYICMPEG